MRYVNSLLVVAAVVTIPYGSFAADDERPTQETERGIYSSYAFSGSQLRAYLASPQATAESEEARRLLAEVATQLESLKGAESGRFCGTPLVPLVGALNTELSSAGRAAVQVQVAGLLARPVLDTFYDSPSAPFRVHYSTSGPDSVRNATSDTAADGRPAYVHETAAALVRSWEMLIDTLGYPVPRSDGTAGGGDSLYDCYLAAPFGPFVIGFTAAETWFGIIIGTDTIRSATTYSVVHPTMAPFPQLSDPLDLLRITCAHEFYHSLHFRFDLDEKPSWQIGGGWWLEGGSMWFEDVAFPDVNDWSSLPFFLNEPERSITDSRNLSDLHPFGGGSMWCFYLVERFGGPNIIRDIWNRCGLVSDDNTLAATDSVLQTLGSSLDEAWHDFASWCMRTGARWDNTSFLQGADWPLAKPVATLFDYPRAVHFTDGSDNLDQNLDPSVPVTTAPTPLEGMAFAPVGHIAFPSNRTDSSMSFFVDAAPGLPVSYFNVGLDTTVGSVGVVGSSMPVGDTTVFPTWLDVDTMFIVASSGVHYDPGDTLGDPLASVTAVISAALDSSILVDVEEREIHPVDFQLSQNLPNPFNPETSISFSISRPSFAELRVYNTLGQVVATLAEGVLPAGSHQVVWNGLTNGDNEAASGVYFYRLSIDNRSETRKMLLVR